MNKKEDYLCNSKVIGEVLIPLIEFYECRGCHETTLSPEASHELITHVREQERNAIASLSSDDLITAGQAAAILGVSKQAFSKNPKIKKGYVYFTQIGTKKAYFRKSVELFRESGDGRFPITKWKFSHQESWISQNDNAREGWQEVVYQVDVAQYSKYTWSSSLRAGL
ncbi:MAG: hypothetical protein HKP41_17045 [Desulfobacterales bacterium]|nr:hypothetical protein [Deltaproteobacteria bacterium]NNK96060.1 hypothetical protein [Desulfobacterales bacterium]